MCAVFQNVDVAKYAAQGVLIPVDEYITEENTPNIWKMFTNHSTTKAIATSPDGHIYALSSYGGSPEPFLETYWWINQAWLDTFYSKEASIINQYGEVEGAENCDLKKTFYMEDGMFKWNDYAEQGYGSISEMYYGNSTKGPHILGYMNRSEDRGVLIEDMDAWKELDELWAMYEPYADPETWPRPYYSPEDSSRLGVLQTDIFNVVEQNKANWIMGRSDVDADWDNYIKQLKTLGVDEYLEINQKTYDVFQQTIDELTK